MIQFSKEFLKTALFSALTLFLFNVNGTAQDATPSNLFVKIEGITPADYGMIVKKMRLHSEFDTKQACVPAELMIFEISGDSSSQTSFEAIEDLIKEATNLTNIILLEDFTYENFMTDCRAQRGRAY